MLLWQQRQCYYNYVRSPRTNVPQTYYWCLPRPNLWRTWSGLLQPIQEKNGTRRRPFYVGFPVAFRAITRRNDRIVINLVINLPAPLNDYGFRGRWRGWW